MTETVCAFINHDDDDDDDDDDDYNCFMDWLNSKCLLSVDFCRDRWYLFSPF